MKEFFIGMAISIVCMIIGMIMGMTIAELIF